MTGRILKFTHGAATLDMNDGNYCYTADFVPPATQMTPQISRGTALSPYAGGVKVSERANDVQWGYTAIIKGDSEADIRRKLSQLTSFLRRGDEVTPLLMQYKGNDDVPFEPIWGQYGANMRYKIIHADTPELTGRIDTVPITREKLAEVSISLLLAPLGEGVEQELASVKGGISEDMLGVVGAASRGVMIQVGTTNKAINQIFGHSTWNYGWLAGSSLVTIKNTDERFLYPGADSSAKIIAGDTSNNVFYQTINVGNTNTHTFTAYIKKVDGSSVTSSDVTIYYNGSKASTYVDEGDGIYKVEWTGAGINSNASMGITVLNRNAVYLLGYQCEEKGNSTSLNWGDLLGSSWSGTAHESTSTRAAGQFRIPVKLNDNMTFSVAWMAREPSATTFDYETIIADENNNVRLYVDTATTPREWRISDGTTATTSGGDDANYVEGDIIVLHFVISNGSMVLYKDGVAIITQNSYTIPTVPTYYELGHRSTGAHINGTFLMVSIYDIPMTATQVLADATNIAAAVADNDGLAPIPWLWTKDGDKIIDGCDDSTRDNWAMCGGIPGSIKALTEIALKPPASTAKTFWVGVNEQDYSGILPHSDQYYLEAQGTADTNASGGEYKSRTLGTVPLPAVFLSPIKRPKNLTGTFHFFVRFKLPSGTADIDIYPWISINGVAIYSDLPSTKAASTAYTMNYAGQLFINQTRFLTEDMTAYFAFSFGGTGTLHVDFAQIIDGPLRKLIPLYADIPGGGGALSYYSKITIKGTEGKVDSGSYILDMSGDVIELAPRKANRLYTILADDAGSHSITDTIEFDSVKITPRYSLL